MKKKLGIIGGSGLYEIDGFSSSQWETIDTPWGSPSDQIFNLEFEDQEICFIPRHGRGHVISPSNINFRANIDALKQKGVTDVISISAVGSLKEDLPPGKFVLVDQFIDRTFARTKTFFDEELPWFASHYILAYQDPSRQCRYRHEYGQKILDHFHIPLQFQYHSIQIKWLLNLL